MAFGNYLHAHPHCMSRIPWFVRADSRKPWFVPPDLLADLFDLTYKFGLVGDDGHSRTLDFNNSDPPLTVLADMPRTNVGPKMSVTFNMDSHEAGTTFRHLHHVEIAGCDGSPGHVEWDKRILGQPVWSLIRYMDSVMDSYGCVNRNNGERFGIFEIGHRGDIRLPVEMYFEERGTMLRLPDGAPDAVMVKRFVPKDRVVSIRTKHVSYLCRSGDVEFLRKKAEVQQRVSADVYRKYGFKFEADSVQMPDPATRFRIQAEIDERVDRTMRREEKNLSKRGSR